MYRLSPASRRAGPGSDTPAMRTVTQSVVRRQHVDTSGRSQHTALAGEDTGLGGPGTVPPRPAGAGTGLGRQARALLGRGSWGGLCSLSTPRVWHWKASGRCAPAPTPGVEGMQSPWCRTMAWMMRKIPSGLVSRSRAGCRPSSPGLLSRTSFSRSGQGLADPTRPRPAATGLELGFEAGFPPADHG